MCEVLPLGCHKLDWAFLTCLKFSPFLNQDRKVVADNLDGLGADEQHRAQADQRQYDGGR